MVTEEQVKLAFEMKRRYYCTVGDALDTMVPPTVLSVGDRRVKAARLVDMEEATELLDSGDLRSLKQVRVIELLLEHDEASCIEIRQAADVSQGVLNTLAKNGIIEFFRGPSHANYRRNLKRSSLPTLSRLRRRRKSH